MIKLVPSKKVAPFFIPYICAGVYIAVVVLVVTGIINLVTGDTLTALILLGISILTIALLVFVNFAFSWYKSAELCVYNNLLVYNITNIIGVLGKDITKYQIKSISSYKKKGKDLIVYGDIRVFEPMCKGKSVDKVIIYDINEDVVDMVNKYSICS